MIDPATLEEYRQRADAAAAELAAMDADNEAARLDGLRTKAQRSLRAAERAFRALSEAGATFGPLVELCGALGREAARWARRRVPAGAVAEAEEAVLRGRLARAVGPRRKRGGAKAGTAVLAPSPPLQQYLWPDLAP